MSETKPGLWESIGRSFDPRFYSHILEQSLGRTMAFLLILSVIISFAVSFAMAVSFFKVSNNAREWVRTHMDQVWPQGFAGLKIDKGEASSETPQPFSHKWGNFTVVFDTTGKVTSLAEYNQGILITKNKMIFKTTNTDGTSETKESDLAKVDGLKISPGDPAKEEIARITMKGKSYILDQRSLATLANIFIGVMFLLALIFMIGYYFVSKLAHAAVFLLFALLVNSVSKTQLDHRKLFNICAYAVVPASIISVVFMAAAGLYFQLPPPVYGLTVALYILLAIRKIKEPTVI